MAAGYERVPGEERVVHKGLFASVWSWISPTEPPIVPPVFRPITRELTKEEKWIALRWVDESLGYLGAKDKSYPKNIQRGLDLMNQAAECGQRSACNNLAYSYRNGRNGLPIDLDKADDYERHGKWSSVDDERPAQASAAPAAAPAPEPDAGRRSSGGSDSSTSASDTSGGATSGLRHRGAAKDK